MNKIFKNTYFYLFVCFVVMQNNVWSQETVGQHQINELRIAIEGLSVLGSANWFPLYHRRTLTQVYNQNSFQFIWTNNLVETLFSEIIKADEEGLKSADYHVDDIRRLLMIELQLSSRELVQRELICSDAFLHYTSHMLSGKVNPLSIDSDWGIIKRDGDPVELLLSLAHGEDLKLLINSTKPKFKSYDQLKKKLKLYKKIKAVDNWSEIAFGPALKVGMSDTRVSQLRSRLKITDGAQTDIDSLDLFDSNLELAVKEFQKRHGLEVDGIVGNETLKALNVSTDQRIQQIVLNLERCRWLSSDLGECYILVNLPAFELEVVQNKNTVMKMDVAIGKPFRQTPVFSATMSYLVFNPYWTVPPTILYKDIIPAQAKDSNYLKSLYIKVLNSSGEEIAANTINWSTYAGGGFPYLLRQEPGNNNALGKVKFIFPNAYNVYMHDTNHRELFKKSERALSSGCIRLSKPIDLANFILAEDKGWSQDKVHNILQSNQNYTVVLSKQYQVHLQYWTAFVNEAGQLNFRKDVYKRDAILWKEFNALPEIQY